MSSTSIEWADCSWSPVTGCTPVSEGCRNCYAKRMAQRMRGRFGYPADDPFRPGTVHWDKLEDPLRWHKPRRVFVCSMGDLFHDAVPLEAIGRVLLIARSVTNHIFMFLTKRPERMRQALLAWDMTGETNGLPCSHLWFGVSVEDQRTANERIPILLQTPAAVRFVSCEPLLGPVDLEAVPYDPAGYEGFPGMHNALIGEWWPAVGDAEAEYRGRVTELPKIDWVICGSETGPKRRPARPEWIRRLKDQCFFAGVPFFLKQMEVYGRIVKMPTLDGREWNQWPGVRS